MTTCICIKLGMAIEMLVAVKGEKWAGSKALCLRANTILAEDSSLVLNTHVGGSQPLVNPALSYSDATGLLCHLHSCASPPLV